MIHSYKLLPWKNHIFNTFMVKKKVQGGIGNRSTVIYTFRNMTLRKCDIWTFRGNALNIFYMW